jgi:transmembrane sensor
MEEKRIIQLLTRKLADEANQTELEELDLLLTLHPNAVYYEEIMRQFWLPASKNLETSETFDEIFEKHMLRLSEAVNNDMPVEHEAHIETNNSSNNKVFRYTLACFLPFLILIGGYFLWTSNSTPLKTTIIIAGRGMRKEFKLPDGTQVWLNAESELRYSANLFKNGKREVSLSGEAFFDVSHDKHHPFVVRTDKYAIKVLGTAFNVNAYPDNEKSTTTLIRGSIELLINSIADQKITLCPSERLALTIHNAVNDKKQKVRTLEDVTLKLDHITPLKIGRNEYVPETSWKEDKLVFQNETLEELLPKLERWFNVRIKVENQKALTYQFTGIFTNESIGQALAAMKIIKRFNYSCHDNYIAIY